MDKLFTVTLPLGDKELLREVKQEIEGVLEPENTTLYIRPIIKEAYSGSRGFHLISCCKISVYVDNLSYGLLSAKSVDWIRRGFNSNYDSKPGRLETKDV